MLGVIPLCLSMCSVGKRKNGHLELGKISGCCREIAGKEKKTVNMSFKHYKVVQLCFILSNSIGQET